MSGQEKPRLIWFDANRVFAAMGVELIHSTTDFAGQPFANNDPAERLFPVFLRSLGEFSGSEMFFMFSLFLMAMRVDRKMPVYGTAIRMQAKRLLVPFAFWVVFYAFFRLVKADAFGYAPYIREQILDGKNWLGYFVLGKSQYHMHFLPTLFALFLFYPVMKVATRYPIIGFALLGTIGVMNSAQGFVWGLGLDPALRDYVIRALKIFGYVGFGLAAFAIYGLPVGERLTTKPRRRYGARGRRNRINAAFCCGAGSIHRREAVIEAALRSFGEKVEQRAYGIEDP